MIGDWIEWKLRIKLNRSKQIAKKGIKLNAFINIEYCYIWLGTPELRKFPWVHPVQHTVGPLSAFVYPMTVGARGFPPIKSRAPIGGENGLVSSNREQCKFIYKNMLLNRTSPFLLTYHRRLDTRAELTALVAFSLYYGSKKWMFYLSLCTDTDGGKSHNLLELYHKTLYEGKYEVWFISSTEFFSQVQGSVSLPMLFTIFVQSFSQSIILPTHSVHWASFLIYNVNDIFYLFPANLDTNK